MTMSSDAVVWSGPAVDDGELPMTVTDTGWVDTGSFRPNRGQFPIRVERHLNSFVGDHLPGVTTVTNATRYYALHGLAARIANDEELDEPATIDLLRRSEALLAYVTHLHAAEPGHKEHTPSPHGIDAILRSARTPSGVNLREASRVYSDAKWAFANPYRGSELTLKILATGSFAPGEWYDHAAASSVLRPLVDVARSASEVTDVEAGQLSPACLCTTSVSEDGAWLGHLLSGDPGKPRDNPTVGGLLWQFGRLVAVASTVGEVSDADSLADLVMFEPKLRTHPKLAGMVAPPRWQGALLRKESVYARRLIWRDINRMVGGTRPVSELVDAFADRLPAGSVAEFRSALPDRLDKAGRPRAAERELGHLSELEQWLARVVLGAGRLADLSGHELRGFRGPQEQTRGVWEEMSPGWVAEVLDRYATRSIRDLGHHLANVLIHRSQRVALWKSRYDPRNQVLRFPARLHVRDGIAIKIFEETAPVPATRIPQYLSLARQAGMFISDANGRLSIGPNGGRLA
ncbi:hypothetical protein ACFPJ1_06335 [Kribbella qitaiheensis]|uniref:hypothetical protein n=1 Tax=Kribbella qitaiheensis TaxID=1544730 RepID=UPI003609B470